jgi:hypothetical protein
MVLNILKDGLSADDTAQMITHIIHINILYHENKIQANLDDEVGMKYRRDKIIELHKYLHQTIAYVRNSKEELINLQIEISL